jgi:hypothetical protein
MCGGHAEHAFTKQKKKIKKTIKTNIISNESDKVEDNEQNEYPKTRKKMKNKWQRCNEMRRKNKDKIKTKKKALFNSSALNDGSMSPIKQKKDEKKINMKVMLVKNT